MFKTALMGYAALLWAGSAQAATFFDITSDQPFTVSSEFTDLNTYRWTAFIRGSEMATADFSIAFAWVIPAQLRYCSPYDPDPPSYCFDYPGEATFGGYIATNDPAPFEATIFVGATLPPPYGALTFATATEGVIIRFQALTMDEGMMRPFESRPLPEPATWAMMIVGFGLIGGMMRRRQSAATIGSPSRTAAAASVRAL